jgi:hypothetical protein
MEANMLKKIINIIAHLLLASLFAGFMAVMFIEWMAGCGETYIDSKGVRHANECIIINHGGNK